MKDKHTPGPWKVDGTYIYEVEQDKILAEVETYNNNELPYEANARLIAAAPEMYEFIKDLASTPTPPGSMPYNCYADSLLDAVSDAKGLIEKIEGDE